MTLWNLSRQQSKGSVKDVPLSILMILLIALAVQIYWSVAIPLAKPETKILPTPPSQTTAQLMSLNDSIAVARIFMLWLQAADHQSGISVPFKELDYGRVISWLKRILALDPKSQYPLLAAARIYSLVEDDHKRRQMLDFIYKQFPADPNRRWPTMFHAVYIAKHKLKDYPLALKFARAVSRLVTSKDVPYWVKQMEIYVLEDMGEIESAKVLVGGLLESGVIKDPHELEFLKQRLNRLEESDDSMFKVIPLR